MYLIKATNIKINKTIASEVIGVSRVHLTNIMNGRIECTKTLAYCITKYLNQDAEIEDYFIRKEN